MRLYPLNFTEDFTLAATYRVSVTTSAGEEPTVFRSEGKTVTADKAREGTTVVVRVG